MNKLLKTLIKNGELSLSVIDTTDLVNDAIKIHNLYHVCAAALGRTLTVCSFMSSNLKNAKDKLYVTIKGDGPIGKITVCGNGNLEMRGSVDNAFLDIPLKPNGKLDVSGAVGKKGRLTIVRSMGLKEPYSGSSELVSGEIAEDFTAYYAFSEQTPTAMALGVLIGTDGTCIGAGGVIMQLMPGASEETIKFVEEKIKEFKNVSELIKDKGANGLIKEYFGVEECTELYPKYKCLCDREYVKGILVSLGKKELLDIIKKEGAVKVNCEFCRTEYAFSEKEVEEMFE